LLERIINKIVCLFVGHDPKREIILVPKTNTIRCRVVCKRCWVTL
jgi:hypothetical protein